MTSALSKSNPRKSTLAPKSDMSKSMSKPKPKAEVSTAPPPPVVMLAYALDIAHSRAFRSRRKLGHRIYPWDKLQLEVTWRPSVFSVSPPTPKRGFPEPSGGR